MEEDKSMYGFLWLTEGLYLFTQEPWKMNPQGSSICLRGDLMSMTYFIVIPRWIK
jgi:hypothetical protein